MCQGKPRRAREATAHKPNKSGRPLSLFTIGHSTHSTERFIELLAAAGVNLVADVRSFPGSARCPQFGRERLKASLDACGIAYLWFPDLGGRRRLKDGGGAHAGWEHPAFRAYAEYTESEEFKSGLASLIGTARDKRVAVMCAEGLWWRCHRRLIADQLLVRGLEVTHIMPDGQLEEHVLTPFAVVCNGRLAYPAPAQRASFSASRSQPARRAPRKRRPAP